LSNTAVQCIIVLQAHYTTVLRITKGKGTHSQHRSITALWP